MFWIRTGDEITASRQPIRPSRVWYWVAGAVSVGSVVCLVLSLFLGFGFFVRQVEGLQRVPIPGQAEVSFDKSGGYIVYFEGLGAADKQVTIPSFTVSLTAVDGGEEVPIRPYEGSQTYNVRGRSGRAVGTFQIDEPGGFLLQAAGESQAIQANVAVGPSALRVLYGVVGLTIVAMFILFVAGMALAVVVAVLRGRARRALLAPAIQQGTWTQGAAQGTELLEPTPSSHPAPYIERFSFTWDRVRVLLGMAGVCIGASLSGTSLPVRLPTVAFFGGLGLILLFPVLRRVVALRVDHQGVTLGDPPAPWRRRNWGPLAVPWRDLHQIVLFDQRVGLRRRLPYIGLALHPGVPLPPAAARHRGLFRLSASLLSHVPPEMIPLSRPINGWRLDRARLLEAVTAYAPNVRVVKLQRDGSVQPVTTSPPDRPWGSSIPS